MRILRTLTLVSVFIALGAAACFATPIAIINNATLGYYNQAIGNTLNGSAGFPAVGDPLINPAPAPDLSAASAILGNWLTNPGSLNANWTGPQAIPLSWPIGTETAIVYQFNTTGITSVIGNFGVDNGIYIWLDGAYKYGALAPGGVGTYEYPNINLGVLGAGTHYLQIMREDHGGSDGYTLLVTADSRPVPEPASLMLMAAGLAGLAGWKKRK